MRCTEAITRMSAYVDGELDRESSSAMTTHLESCRTCREYLAELSSLDALIGRLPQIEIGEGFSKRAVARAKEWDELADAALRPSAPSVFDSLRYLLTDVLDTMVSESAPAIQTLEEFADFPPLSLGCAYFQILGHATRG